MAMIKCPECKADISDQAAACPRCGCPATRWRGQQFQGIYRVSFWTGKKTPIYCPRCKSANCSWFVETIHHDAVVKSKTKYTANLNPLHPFTLVNKKEKKKVITPEYNTTQKKIVCNNCGYTFF